MFREQGLPNKPSIEQVLSLLDRTAGSNSSSERETSEQNPKKYAPPAKVRTEAFKGIQLSYEHNYPSYNGIGLARAVQLATQEKIWANSVNRMQAFFGRNKRYTDYEFNDAKPGKSYLAWLNWGGCSGRDWVESL